jgi:hypothetical protein
LVLAEESSTSFTACFTEVLPKYMNGVLCYRGRSRVK